LLIRENYPLTSEVERPRIQVDGREIAGDRKARMGHTKAIYFLRKAKGHLAFTEWTMKGGSVNKSSSSGALHTGKRIEVRKPSD